MSFSGSYITNFLFVVVAIYVLKFVVCYKRRSLALTWNMWLAKSANVNCGERAKVQDIYCTAATKNEICWDFMFSHHKALLSTFVAQWISRKVLLRTRHTLDTSEIWDCLHFTNPSMFLADSICMMHWMQAEDSGHGMIDVYNTPGVGERVFREWSMYIFRLSQYWSVGVYCHMLIRFPLAAVLSIKVVYMEFLENIKTSFKTVLIVVRYINAL